MDVTLNRFLSTDYLPLAIPWFLAIIAVEGLWTAYRGRDLYRLNDSINSISVGSMIQLVKVLNYSAGLLVYIYLFDHFRAFDPREHGLATQIIFALVGFLAVDLSYYVKHRASHRVNFLWAGHGAHHQSEEFNYSTALRQGIIEEIISRYFYLPWAFVGLPPTWLIGLVSIDSVYQFSLHTRSVNKMPRWFEAVFNTPSHHRVHHAKNPQYLDKNYAGTLIIWDRMFGTFEPEVEPCVFGTTKPLASWNPIWAQVHHLVAVGKQMASLPRIRDKLLVWFAPPGWQPGKGRHFAVEYGDGRPWASYRGRISKYDPPVSIGWLTISVVLFVVGVALGLVTVRGLQLDWSVRWAAAAAMVVFLVLAGRALGPAQQRSASDIRV